jgi:ribosomal protein L11 methyltransferase
MKGRDLWQVSIRIPVAGEEAVAEVLEGHFGVAPCSYTDVETGLVEASVFLQAKPHWSTTQRQLTASLRGICSKERGLRSARWRLKRLPFENWAESWKRHFKAMEVGRKLLIRPGWSRRRARKGQVEVVLDPGLSFGTGQHPTTWYCLRELVAQKGRLDRPSFLDVGTGSGILAISAARLGYAPITAIDLDPDAIRVARANARVNTVHRQIRFLCQDLADLPERPGRQYSVVCANLISNLLVEQRQKLLRLVAPGGFLVLAGILRTEFAAVRAAFERAGWGLKRSREQNEWKSGTFLPRKRI